MILVPSLGGGALSGEASVRLTLCGTGVAIALFSLWALADPLRSAPEWLNMVAALWLFLSPWLVGYDDMSRIAAETAWATGALILVLAIWASERANDAMHGPHSS